MTTHAFPSDRTVIIGSRGSDLALWQAHWTQDRLTELGVRSEIVIIKTQGDKIQHLSFDKLEGKGFFTKEIEDQLTSGAIDLAVHSHKDLETNPPAGLVIAAVSHREDPSELLLVRKEAVDVTRWGKLREGALVGTSSARRKSQLLAFRPDIELKDLRGNVPTRIQKLRDGQYDAIMLARAGVVRLGLDLSDLHVEVLDPRAFVPAPAQGVLGLQIRESDTEMSELLAHINHEDVARCIRIERKVLNLFQGGCQLPLGVMAKATAAGVEVWASVAAAWDALPNRLHVESGWSDELPQQLVTALRKQQAAKVFITRQAKPTSYLNRTLAAAGLQVSGRSLIETRAVPFEQPEGVSWIFFSSPTGARHFIDNGGKTDGHKLAAMGQGTAQALLDRGLQPTFVGEGPDTKVIAQQFAKRVGDEQVLFPISDMSVRTAQKAFTNTEQVRDLLVYQTTSVPVHELPDADVFVVSSPSNARALFTHQKPGQHQHVVAMGPSTAYQLAELGITATTIPWSTSEVALADAVLSIGFQV